MGSKFHRGKEKFISKCILAVSRYQVDYQDFLMKYECNKLATRNVGQEILLVKSYLHQRSKTKS